MPGWIALFSQLNCTQIMRQRRHGHIGGATKERTPRRRVFTAGHSHGLMSS